MDEEKNTKIMEVIETWDTYSGVFNTWSACPGFWPGLRTGRTGRTDGPDGTDGRTGRTGRTDGPDGRTEYSFRVLLASRNTVLQYYFYLLFSF